MALACAAACAQPVRVGVDPRIELMSIIARLAGYSEYSDCRVPAYSAAIDRHFAKFRTHDAVRILRKLRKSQGVSYNAVMDMAVHLKDAQSLAERTPFDKPGSDLEIRWYGVKARPFLEAARRFVVDAKFAEFVASQQSLYDTANSRLRALVDGGVDLAWFDRFFGAHPPVRFYVIPGLANGQRSYGASTMGEDGIQEIYAFPETWHLDAEGLPVFNANNYEGNLVHEFAHSYVAPLVNKFGDDLDKPAAAILKPVRDAMRKQAYGTPRALLYESLVRASVVRYAAAHYGAEAARRRVGSDRARSFTWVGDLSDLLGEYEKQRDRYPTLEAFMPEVVKFFERLASGAASGQTQLVRRYVEGEKLTYRMTGDNQGRRYEFDAIGEVKCDAAGRFFEEYEWRGLTAPVHTEFRQRVSLDQSYDVVIPDLRQADPALIGPVLDFLNFYADLRLAMRLPGLAKAGDHAYFKHGKPNSWADGRRVLVGEDAIDFDVTLAAVDKTAGLAKLVVRHVPPERPQLNFPAEWMRTPVTGTANNWIQVAKREVDYVASAGSEVINVELDVRIADGRIVSARMDNPVEVSERICTDAGLSRCGEPRRYQIRRQIRLASVPR